MEFGPVKYYIAKGPSINDLARSIIALVRKHPGIQIVMTKRDIASALRPLREHPSLAQVMVAGIPGARVGLGPDIIIFYLVAPFGWNGPPAHFAQFGDAVT